MLPGRPQCCSHGLPEEKLPPHLCAVTAGEGIDIYTRPKCFHVNQGGSTWSCSPIEQFLFWPKAWESLPWDKMRA